MKNVIKSVYGLMVLLAAMCFMAGCKAEIKYVDKVIEKTYVSPVVFTTVDAGEKGVTITMVTATEGAVIYYTEDGSTPTASSTVYSSAVTYSTDKTVKAIAVKTGMENSPISSVSVSVKTKIVTDTVTKYICPKCEKEYSTAEAAANCCGVQYQDKTYAQAVSFSAEDAGTDGVRVIMTCATEGAVIYYTTDGTTPSASSLKYTSSVTFSADTTVKAIAIKDGIENSPISVTTVKIKTVTEYVDKTYASPVVFNAIDAGDSGVTIIMSTATEGAVIYYTEDGSTPTASSTVYSSAITYNTDKTVKAIAVKSGIENSPVSSVSVTIKTKTVTNTVYTSAVAAGTYNVYHFQQKTSGGKAFADYTLTDTDSSKAVAANTTIETLKKTYAGFTAKAMAQNETAIYIFYDRNTITYTFETGSEGKFSDGTTCKKVSGLYGASYSKPASPTSGDYNFVKWANGETTAPSVFGDESLTFTAVWKAKSSGGETVPEGFVKVTGVEIKGTETWTPSSSVFVSGRAITIPALLVCDHEVTRGEFKTIMGTDPSTASAYDKDGNKLTGDAVLNNPVNYVNWYAAIAYCNKLSIKENLTPCYSVDGITDWENLAYSSIPTSSNTTWNAATCEFTADGYRLPTEAEWEWLARGGENYTYAGSNTVDDVAWYTSNTNDTGSREVKTKQENGYGLYDMSGNVWEWCWDWYSSSISSTSAAEGAASGSGRVQRGGSWYNDASYASVSCRDYGSPYYRHYDYGFRVVRSSSN